MTRRRRNAPPDRNLGTLAALFVLLVLSAGFVFLTAMIMPQIAAFLLVVLGFGVLGVFHYVTWGWLMSKQRFEQLDKEHAERANDED